jgi:hypothetical protein
MARRHSLASTPARFAPGCGKIKSFANKEPTGSVIYGSYVKYDGCYLLSIRYPALPISILINTIKPLNYYYHNVLFGAFVATRLLADIYIVVFK